LSDDAVVATGRNLLSIRLEILMKLTFETEMEADGRWIAEVPEIPGALAYGSTQDEAVAKAEVLALRVLAERIENNETGPLAISIAVAAE
jgi:predicted RNase H-like HicB family nuclease